MPLENDISTPGTAVAIKSAAVVAPAEKSDAQRAEEIAAKFNVPENKPDELDQYDEPDAEDPAEDEEDPAEAQAEDEEDPAEETDEPEIPAPKARGQKADRLAQASRQAREGARRNRELQARAQQVELENQQLKERVQQTDGWQAEIIKNPAKFLKSLGIKSEQIVEDIMRAGSPEEKLDAAIQQIAELNEKHDKYVQSIKQDQETAQKVAVARKFWTGIHTEASKADARPNLAALPDFLVEQMTIRTFKEIREAGEDPRDYDFGEIADVMEKRLSAKKAAPAPKAKADPNVRAAPKTLSSRTSERKFQLPANFADLPDDKRVELLNHQASKTLFRR